MFAFLLFFLKFVYCIIVMFFFSFCSFYIHRSVFTASGNNSSWDLLAPANVDYSTNPLCRLFRLLKLRAFTKVALMSIP